MLNVIWFLLLVISIAFSCFNGTLPDIGEALLESGNEAVMFVLGVCGVTALWNGFLDVFQKAGGIDLFARIIGKPIEFLIPGCKNNPEAKKQVVTNVAANFFGLGNGATPSGIKAVEALGREAYSVGMFLVMNSAAFQLLPTSVMALRAAAGSVAPADIVVPVWISSATALGVGLIVYLIIGRRVK